MSMIPPIDPSTGRPYGSFGPSFDFENALEHFNGQYTKINGKIYKIERPSDEEIEQYKRLQKLKRILGKN